MTRKEFTCVIIMLNFQEAFDYDYVTKDNIFNYEKDGLNVHMDDKKCIVYVNYGEKRYSFYSFKEAFNLIQVELGK